MVLGPKKKLHRKNTCLMIICLALLLHKDKKLYARICENEMNIFPRKEKTTRKMTNTLPFILYPNQCLVFSTSFHSCPNTPQDLEFLPSETINGIFCRILRLKHYHSCCIVTHRLVYTCRILSLFRIFLSVLNL